MNHQDGGTISKRLRLLGLEVILLSLFVLALVVWIWALNQGSSLQAVFLWMAIILVMLSIAGVQVLVDARRLSSSGRRERG